MPFEKLPPIYTLPHGIEVIGEYPVTEKNRYARVRIRPHKFFPTLRVIADGCSVRKSRAVMASILGRALEIHEIVHHVNEDRTDDSPENLELITVAAHNRHHKLGVPKSESSKLQVSESLKTAYASGRHARLSIKSRNAKGQIKARGDQ